MKFVKYCFVCNKKFYPRGKRKIYGKFCSYSCNAHYQNKNGIIGFRVGNQFGKMGKKGHCQKLETREKISKNNARYWLNKKRNVFWLDGFKIKRGELMGEKNPRWKGGITSTSQKIRGLLEAKKWSKEILRRFNYICVNCGKKGCYLEAHHIYSWSDFPKLRFDLNNGVPLCRECHG